MPRAIERIPETYRECLVLFYREGESVGRIATELEISEDAVKQRLSRGRKLLTEEITAFVEGALRRSAPGKAFTFGVLAALPTVPSPAKAAAIGTAAVKGGSTAVKAAVGSGVFNAILGPALALFGTYFGYKLDRDTARSPGAQQFVSRYYSLVVIGMAAFGVAVLILVLAGSSLLDSRAKLYAGLWIGLGAASLVVVAAGIAWVCARQRTFREQAADFQLVPLFEYRSNLTLLGWPLVHIRIRGGLERGPVKAWIAAGDSAIGVLFALGAVAIAPISLGGLSMGLVTVGGLAVGLLSLGGFSFGAWAIGAFALGWQSYGACAIAWSAAQGAVACAGDFASGGAAIGRHANDSAAQEFFANSRFYQNVQVAMRYAPWLNLLCLFPLLLWWRQKKTMQQRANM